jgi:hypothetical protein
MFELLSSVAHMRALVSFFKSKLLILGKLTLVLFAPLLLVGCWGSKATPVANNTISLYDTKLTFIANVSVANGSAVDLGKKAIEYGVNGWYLPKNSTAINGTFTPKNDINLYAVANVAEIVSQAELNSVRDDLSGNYILTHDINLTVGEGLNSTEGWSPIGDTQNPFKGVFNGNAHKIIGLWIDRPSSDYIGLFGRVEGATIKNLGILIDDSRGGIQGRDSVGGIAGGIEHNAIIADSYVVGDVGGTHDAVGGIVGFARFHSTIADSYFTGNINGVNFVGGIAGEIAHDSTITRSYAVGNISGTDTIGGIAGIINVNSAVTLSYHTGDISGNNQIGGIAGLVSTNSMIADSYHAGDIGGAVFVGGIVGNIRTNSSVIRSYSVGNVNGTGTVGGIAGYSFNSLVANNTALNHFINGASSANRIAGFIGGPASNNNFALNATRVNGSPKDSTNANGLDGADKSDAELKTQATYEAALGWGFGSDDTNPWVWGKFDGYPYPTLYWQTKAPK